MKPPRFSLWIFMLIVFFAILLVSPDSDAGGDELTSESQAISSSMSNSSAVIGESHVDVGGDKNRAYALGVPGLGDVDIAGCLGSTQWTLLIGGKQKLETNWWCVTKLYLEAGLYDNAAMAICNTEVREEFATEQDCRDAHPFKAMATIVPTESEDEDEEHERFQAEIEALAARLSASEEKTAQAKAEARKARRAAQAPPQTVIQREPFIDADKRAALEALKGEK